MAISPAQGKAVPAIVAKLRVDNSGMREQEVSIRGRGPSSRPPEAIRRASVQLTVGVMVAASTQEIERKVS